MSRTTPANRVYVIGALVMALLTAGLTGLLVPSAGAAVGDATTVSITPVYPTDNSFSAGTCAIYRIVPKTGLGQIASDSGNVVITLKENPNSGTQDVDFCLPPSAPDGQSGTVVDHAYYTNSANASGGTPANASKQKYCAGESLTPPSPTTCGGSGTTNNPDQASNATLTTDPLIGADTNPSGTDLVDDVRYTNDVPNRQFIQFGVTGLVPGSATIDACISNNDGDCADSSDVVAGQVTVTFTPGGRPDSVEAYNAVTSITTDRTQYSAVQSTNTQASILTNLLNNRADTVFGVVPNFRVQSGPNADSTVRSCTRSTDFGDSTCSYIGFPNVGTDTILIWVNHSAPPNGVATAGPDPGEPTTQVTVSTFAQPAQAASARTIDLQPDGTVSTTAGQSRTFTAVVVDGSGTPVQGVAVLFSESGPGTISGGTSPDGNTSSRTVATAANGRADVTVTTQAGESGVQTVTASISPNDTQCGALFNGQPGKCSDSTTNQIGGGASPSPTATASTSPTATSSASPSASASTTGTATSSASPSAACQVTQVSINTPTINATGLASVTAFGATPGSRVELQGYSQDHFGTQNFDNDPTPVDRVGTADSNGTITFNDLRPSSNTRVRARQVGCAYGGSAVVNVRTTIFLKVTRDSARTYTFEVDSIPARPGGLIVSIYRITGNTCAAGVEPRNCPGEPFVSQTRVSSIDGTGSRTLKFDSSYGGREQFVLKTGQDAQNAPGRSNVRDLAIF